MIKLTKPLVKIYHINNNDLVFIILFLFLFRLRRYHRQAILHQRWSFQKLKLKDVIAPIMVQLQIIFPITRNDGNSTFVNVFFQ